jgi:signal peptidase II
MEVRSRQPRTALLWTLAGVIIVADQLSKAWFVFRLGSAQQSSTFLEFLPKYLLEFKTTAEGSIIFDQYGGFSGNQIMVWDPWIRFYLTTNTGAAWSIFAGNSFALSFVSLAIAALLHWVWRRNFLTHHAMTWAIGAIIGGALGNCIDRFRLREVVDFIAVKIPLIGKLFPKLGDPYNFPIFNIADASAVCGTLALAGYLLWLDLTAGKRKRQKEEAETRRKREPWKGGIQLDDEALANLHNLDTKSVKPWTPEDQQEVSAARAEQVIAAERAAELPELTSNYQPTASEVELLKKEDND